MFASGCRLVTLPGLLSAPWRQRGGRTSKVLGLFGRRQSTTTSSSPSSSSTQMVASLFDPKEASSANANSTSKDFEPQTVAVIGSGAVGSYYGSRLWQAGHDVHFYLRPSPASARVRQTGLRIQSIDGDFAISPDELQLYDSTTAMPSQPDWILIGLKSTALSAIPDLILPLLSPKTNILVLMNGLVDEDLIRLLKQATGQAGGDDSDEPLACCRTLYGGLAFIAANRVAPGDIHHLYAGPIAAGVASTQVSMDATTARQELLGLWHPVATVPCQWEDNLAVGRWRKMLWNLPFNGISVAMGGLTTDQIVQDASLRSLARCIMEETLAVAVAECGEGALQPSHIDSMFALTDTMGAYRPSTMIDLLERRPMEVEYLFRKPLQRAQALGVDTPHLFTIVSMIEALQSKYDLF